jgi:hypothetical protein
MTIYHPWKRIRTRMGRVTVAGKGWMLEGWNPTTGHWFRKWFATDTAAQQYATKRNWPTNK